MGDTYSSAVGKEIQYRSIIGDQVTYMVRVYIEQNGAPLHLPMSLVFWPNFKFEISPKRLFLRGIMEAYQKPFVEIAESPESADFFAIPFEYFFVEKYAPAYLSSIYDAARRAGKKVLLFDYTDFVDRTPRLPPHAIFFRVSVYRHHQTPGNSHAVL